MIQHQSFFRPHVILLHLQTVAGKESRRPGGGVAWRLWTFSLAPWSSWNLWWFWSSSGGLDSQWEHLEVSLNAEKKAGYSKTTKAKKAKKAKTFSTKDLLLTFGLLKQTLVDINYQIIISESLAVPAADVQASIVPPTVMLALKGVQTLLSALPWTLNSDCKDYVIRWSVFSVLIWRERCTSEPTAVPFAFH